MVSNQVSINGKRFFEEVLENTYESSASCLSREDRPSVHQYHVHKPVSRSIVDKDSEGFDSQVFRVKRPSILKIEKRFRNKTMSSKNSEHEGLKRLKKPHHERCEQPVPTECCRKDEPNHNINRGSNCKQALKIATKERFGRGTLPISIKHKKLDSEAAMSRQRDHHRNERFQLELGKRKRELPLEIGPKRLKVRGPVYLGSESRPV